MAVHPSEAENRWQAPRLPAPIIGKTAEPVRVDMPPVRLEKVIASHRLLIAVVLLWSVLAGCAKLDTDLSSTETVKLRNLAASSDEPLNVLYVGDLTRGGDVHDRFLGGVSERLNVSFTVIGKHPGDAKALLAQPNFALGYDAVVYNTCFAEPASLEMAENAIAQTRDYGIGALVLPCGVRSFGYTSPFNSSNRQHQAALSEWASRNGERAFPYWWSFVGVALGGSEYQDTLRVVRPKPIHPVAAVLPKVIGADQISLATNAAVNDGVLPVYFALGQRDNQPHLVAWSQTVGVGRVFSTTLGNRAQTMTDDVDLSLYSRGLAYVAHVMTDDGSMVDGYQGTERIQNYQDTTHCQPSDVITASTIGDVQAVVRRALEVGKPMKVISVERSNSDNAFICPEQGGLLLNVYPMRNVLALDEANLTVTVQPGIRATDLSSYLHDRGYAIRAMPDYTGVSIAGSIATGAHHSSLNVPAGMADMVTALTIVDGRGEIRRFEGAEASQASVHLGMLGVVVEVTLRIEPQFKLQYGHESGTDEDLESIIEELVRSHEYARVMWFAGNGRYVADYYDRVDENTPGESRHNLWSSTGAAFKWVGDLPYRVLNGAPPEAQCDSALLRAKYWIAPFRAIDSPSSAPVGWSHKMLGSICAPGDCPWDRPMVKSRTMEAAFPLDRLQEWMGDVRSLLAQRRACFPILGIYLRFLPASDRPMAINYGRDTVAFEIHIPKVVKEDRLERSADVYDEIMQMTLYKYGGRPHWGKNSTPFFTHLGPEQYPQWETFLSLKQGLDPTGLFDNRIWRQMTNGAAVEPYPGCVLARDCICEVDAHCGAGYSCEAGDVFAPARVCRVSASIR